MDREAWQATVHGAARSRTEQFSLCNRNATQILLRQFYLHIEFKSLEKANCRKDPKYDPTSRKKQKSKT